MGKKEFAAAALDPEHETFVVNVASLSSTPLEARLQIPGLIVKKAPSKIPTEYSDFADVFSPDLASELSKQTRINNYAIERVNDCQQPPYRSIYSLRLVELETLKTYIETNLANRFIRPSKFPDSALILFDWKSDGFLRLCVNYRSLNNLTIKNRYPLPLIEELLDRLGRAKQFTRLALTNAYHWIRIRKGNEWKTTFRTQYSHFEYQMMSFGLINAPASFQKFINKIPAEKLNIFVIMYLDNFFFYTDDDGDGYVAAVRWVLKQLSKFLLFANLKKCRYHQDEFWFLRNVVFSKDIHIEDKKIKAVKHWLKP